MMNVVSYNYFIDSQVQSKTEQWSFTWNCFYCMTLLWRSRRTTYCRVIASIEWTRSSGDAGRCVLIYLCSRYTLAVRDVYTRDWGRYVQYTRVEGIELYMLCLCRCPVRPYHALGVKNIRAQMTETLADVKKVFSSINLYGPEIFNE